jgi:hypothetical protein
MYDKSTVYIVGNSRTNEENAITTQFNSFFIGFVIDINNDEIVDLSCSATIRTTEEFIYSLFISKSFSEYDMSLEQEIKRRYHGSSQKAIIVSYKDAVKKYIEIKMKNEF